MRVSVAHGLVIFLAPWAALAPSACGSDAEDPGAAGSAGTAAGGSAGSGGRAGSAGSAGSAGANPSGGSSGSSASGGSGGVNPSDGNGGANPSGGTGGSSGSNGTGGSGGGGSGGSAGSSQPSDLPTPPGGGVAKPSGAPGNLVVLDWAGFKAAASYSFDDAQPSHVEHYAELQAAGVPLTFYLNVGGGARGDDATWMRAARDGHELGNHTVHHCHPDLTGCGGTPLASKEAEIDECSSYIRDHYGQTAWTMASPFGDGGWNDPARSRFLLNRGVSGGQIAPRDDTDPFNLPTVAAAGGEAATPFSAAIDSARGNGRWVIFLFHSILPTSQNWYAGVEIASITTSIAHGRSLGDVWIDSVVHVGAYWRAQKMLSALTPVTSGSDKTWSWTLPPHFPPGRYLRVKVDGGTLKQAGTPLAWDDHGYYEVALDAGSLTLSP